MAQAKAKVVLKKDTAFDAATSLTLDQPTTGVLSDFCNDVIEKEITRCYGAFVSLTDAIIPASALDTMTDKLYDVAPEVVEGQTRLIAGSCFSNFGHFYVLRRWLRVGSGGGSGGNKVFWVDQRVGLKAA
jgi:hypothetical protein